MPRSRFQIPPIVGNYECSGDTASLIVGTTGIVVEVRPVEGYNTPGSYNFTWQGTAASNNFELITRRLHRQRYCTRYCW